MMKKKHEVLLSTVWGFVLLSSTCLFANGPSNFGPPKLPQDVPKPIALYVHTEPHLPLREVIEGKGNALFHAKVGTTVQLRVEAEYEDGSRRDVTETPYTFYYSTDSGSTVLQQTGKVSFKRPHKVPFSSIKEKSLDIALITIAYGRNLVTEIGVNIVP